MPSMPCLDDVTEDSMKGVQCVVNGDESGFCNLTGLPLSPPPGLLPQDSIRGKGAASTEMA